jgi:basic amino acid/polyamine antiporter, APA family
VIPSESQPRKLGLFPVTNIVIANMIGAGIFTTSGLLMADLQHPWLMIALWLAGGVIALSGALCYGELGASFPEAGGEYAFLSKLFHPLAGFLSGWVSFIVGFSAPIAASSIGFSEYLYRAAPEMFGLLPVGVEAAKKLFSTLIIIIFTLVHLRGLRTGAAVQNYLTMLKVLLVAGLIAVGFGWGSGSWQHFDEGRVFTFDLPQFRTIGLSLMWIMFAYSGWNAAVYIGGEIRDPRRNLPRSLIIGTIAVVVLYTGINLLFIYAIGYQDMMGVIPVGGLAVARLFGAATENLFSLLIAFALFSSISAFVLLGPRVYYAMARDGYFFAFAARLDARHQVPVYSILFQGIISVIILLSGTFDQILTYMGFSLGLFPLLSVVGLIRLRRSGRSALRLPGYPITAVLYLVAGSAILVLAFIERPVESSVAIATVLAGLPAWWFFRRWREEVPL